LHTVARLRPGTRHPFQESQLLGTVPPRTGDRMRPDLLVSWTRGQRAEDLPDEFLAPRHFEEAAAVRVDDERVAVGQALLHAAEAREERAGVGIRIDPGQGLRHGVVLDDATPLAPAMIVVNQEMSVV